MTAKSILSMNFTIGQRELESSEPLTTAEQIDLFSKTRDENLKAAASWEKVGRSDFSVMHMKVAESLAKKIIELQGGTSDIESIALDGLGASAIVTDDNYRETRAAEWEAWRNRMSGFVARMEKSRGHGLRKSVLK